MTDDRALAAVVRLDVWLDVACLFRTRSEAQKSCKGGKVDVNGQRAKSNRVVRVGDILELKRPYGRTQRLVVKAITQRHVTKAEARQLYEDLTPAPTAEEIAMRRIERMYRAAVTPTRTPDKRARRALRELKERQR
jgi:ribosome-associated heat shock protein Hsp15